jgi:hypothetical protein
MKAFHPLDELFEGATLAALTRDAAALNEVEAIRES